MAVVVLQHAPAGAPSAVGAALEAARLDIRVYRAGEGDLPADLTGVDAVVVTGTAARIRSGESAPSRDAELELLRGALATEVPVLGLGLGAELLAEAADAGAPQHTEHPGRRPVRTAPVSGSDPLFAGIAPEDHHRVHAFRIGASAWGLPLPLEERWWGLLPARFAELVAGRSEHTATRAFFTRRADAWEERFAYQTPAYEAAVARMGLRRGQTAVDVGCGTGRAMPALRAHVGDEGTVLGLDVTHAMLTAAARIGRAATGRLLLADCARLPLRPSSVHGVFAAGLLDHLPRPRTALREWARVSAPDGSLLLFHPAGRAERAARHGRPLSPEDPLAEPNLRPMLDATGWRLTTYDDAEQHFLARAVLAR
ncbi:methyltransferase domain-containing protein [Streptomyces sp. NPDC048424]|uniref:methyltransferase domain-containing protein n=1 Tax=Streptomyces sp. NPDC048424 TaxID=3155265 RepID=UPI00342B08C3